MKLLAKPVIESIHAQVKTRVDQFHRRHGHPPKLSVVLIGNDPASVIYTTKKGETALALGMHHETIHFDSEISPETVRSCIDKLNQDPKVSGILIQRPLPSHFKEEEVLYWVSPNKDVDAFHPENVGRLFLGLNSILPCTPAGVMALLKHYQMNIAGKTACVVGRSSIVGKPMAALLLQANATVIQCHSRTPDLAHYTKQADLLVVAAGKMGLINASHIKPGAIVIDVGMHRNENGKLAGDVQFDSVAAKAAAITPVPGGVGPMTIAILMQNTILAAEKQSGLGF